MDSREHLYYGLGMLAYAVAKADGEIQTTEKRELQDLIKDWSTRYSSNFDVTEIIFTLFEKTKPSLEEGLEQGLHHVRLGSEHVNEHIKEHFNYLIKDIAHAYPPVTENEGAIISQVSKALDEIG